MQSNVRSTFSDRAVNSAAKCYHNHILVISIKCELYYISPFQILEDVQQMSPINET